ncbi:hypothetical protein SBDP1_330003 [Syntrophobacter sp. SbD1]|nr:hypothetical protein SBDP1_330003 [Syntrophobacter sp. SbD1]
MVLRLSGIRDILDLRSAIAMLRPQRLESREAQMLVRLEVFLSPTRQIN